MRLIRTVAVTAAVLAGIAAWPQDPLIPAVDHSQHPMVEVLEDRPAPSLSLRLAADKMDGFNVFLETQNFRFTPENVGSAIIANEGHAHLYVNGVKVARMYSPWHHLPSGQLREGINRIEVEFSTNDHSVWSLAGGPIGADVLMDTRTGDGDPIVREQVSYTLDWRWGAARRHPEGGWTVTNDLGYSVHVTGGRLVSRNLELVPCAAIPAPSPLASLTRWLGPVEALAGHSSLTPNESKISKSYEEDLADPGSSYLESLEVTDPEYCRAHYLVARATRSRPGAAAFSVTGTWTRSKDERGIPFEIRSSGAYGQFLGLTSAAGDVVNRRTILGGIHVTVSRELGTMFDGVDFASGLNDASGLSVLRAIVADTKVYLGNT